MEINDFLKNFANQWDETEIEVFVPECEFHELEEWSSLIGLAILNMCAKKYGVKVLPTELRECITIQDLYNLILSQQQ